MIAIEVAACLTLLVGAGLTIQSAVGMLRVDMGLDADQVVVGRFSLRQRAYPDPAAWSGFYQRVLSRSGEIAGAQAIAFTNSWPLQQSMTRDVGAAESGTLPLRSGIVGVSPDYFNALSIPLHEGRFFTEADRIGSTPVVLVSRTLANRLWGTTGAVGQQLRIAPAQNSAPTARAVDRTVIGVVGDIRHAHTDNDVADAYVPILQSPFPGAFVYLRGPDTVSAERDLKRLLSSIDGEIAFGASRPLAEILDLQRAGARFLAYLLVVFAVFAATLALVGIYAVVAYTVKQREREIAVRLAIGADRRRITRMFVGQGARRAGRRPRAWHRRRAGARPRAARAVVRRATRGPGRAGRDDDRLRAVRTRGDRVAGEGGGVARFGHGTERVGEADMTATTRLAAMLLVLVMPHAARAQSTFYYPAPAPGAVTQRRTCPTAPPGP